MDLAFTKKFDDVFVAERAPDLKKNVGMYTQLEVTSIVGGETRLEKKAYLKVNAKVIQSQGETALPPGTDVEITFWEDKFNYDLKDYKKFVAALLNTPAAKLNRGIADQLASPENPAAGKFFAAEVYPDPKNTAYTKIRFMAFGAPTTA